MRARGGRRSGRVQVHARDDIKPVINKGREEAVARMIIQDTYRAVHWPPRTVSEGGNCHAHCPRRVEMSRHTARVAIFSRCMDGVDRHLVVPVDSEGCEMGRLGFSFICFYFLRSNTHLPVMALSGRGPM